MRDGNGIAWGNIRPTDAVRVVTDRSPCQQGRDEERAAIVAWLRAYAEHCYDSSPAGVVEGAADEIEAGEHLSR